LVPPTPFAFSQRARVSRTPDLQVRSLTGVAAQPISALARPVTDAIFNTVRRRRIGSHPAPSTRPRARRPEFRHQAKLGGQVRWPDPPHHARHRGFSIRADEASISSHPAPDEELAAIAGAPELAADV